MLLRSSVVAPFVHVYVNGTVPPLTLISIAPFVNPHVAFVGVPERVGGGKFITVVDCVVLQPFASVTVTLYEFAITFEMFCVVAPLDHAYVNGNVPPLTV